MRDTTDKSKKSQEGSYADRKPLITVVTITWNAEAEIVPTAESVAAQTYRDFEHLIIDGASTDSTLALARRHGRPDLRIISEPDNGLYDAMNKGLEQARGRYVLFLNAGDTFHSTDTLEKYARAAVLKKADIVYADTVIVDTARRELGPRHLSVPERLDMSSFKAGMLVCHQAFMVRRELARPYDTGYRFSADYDWCIGCISRSVPERNVNLHCVAIDYLSDGLTDRNKLRSLRERLEVMAKWYGWPVALWRHAGFVPRLLLRKMGK